MKENKLLDRRTVGYIISQVRGSSLSLRRIASLSGLDPGYLCRVVNQKVAPSLNAVDKLIRGMELSPSDILRSAGRLSSDGIAITPKEAELFRKAADSQLLDSEAVDALWGMLRRLNLLILCGTVRKEEHGTGC